MHTRRQHRFHAPAAQTSREKPAPANGTARRALTVIGLAAGAIVLLASLWFTRRVWLSCFAGVLLAIFLRTLANWVGSRTRIAPPWSLVVVIAGLLGSLSLAGWLVAEPVSAQASELAQRLPEAIERVQQHVEERGWMRYLPSEVPKGGNLAAGAQQLLSRLGRVFSGTFEAVASVLLILFLGVYLAAAPETYINGFVRLFPVGARDQAREVLGDLGNTLRYWLLGQIVAMTVVGTLIGVGLALVGVPLPLALGLLAGLLEFIPFVGPLLAGTPAVLLAFTQSPMHAFYVVILFVGVNFLEGHLLVPVVQKYAVALPPAVTVVSLVLMGSLFGFLGLLLATPLAAAALVLVKRVYVERVLEGRAQGA